MNSSSFIHRLPCRKDQIRVFVLDAIINMLKASTKIRRRMEKKVPKGKMVNEHKTWGNKFIANLAADIKLAFPDAKGYSAQIPLVT